MRRAQAGDAEAFDRLVERHGKLVLALARSVTRHAQDAEDVAQEAFLRLYRSIARVDPDRPIEAWLVRLTLNAARSHVARRPERFEDDLAPLIEAGGGGMAADPNAGLEAQDARAALRQAIHTLPPRSREVLLLRDLHGLDTGTIAEALEISPVTVRRLSIEGRQRVLDWLRVHWPGLSKS